jgi:hypothetical protein
MRAELAKMAIALPHDVKHWVESEAERDDRSQNSVVVRALRARMQQDRRAERDGTPS